MFFDIAFVITEALKYPSHFRVARFYADEAKNKCF